jgi:hypothetical protein
MSPAGTGGSSSSVASAQQQHATTPLHGSAADPSRSSTNCSGRRPANSTTASASGSTPPSSSGVLKNVHVSHHMGRSQLTLKFHHVKRHENGLASAAAGPDRPASDVRHNSGGSSKPDSASSRTHGHQGASNSAGDAAAGAGKNLSQTSPSSNGSRRSPTTVCNGGGSSQNNHVTRGPLSSAPEHAAGVSNYGSSWLNSGNLCDAVSGGPAALSDAGRSSVAGTGCNIPGIPAPDETQSVGGLHSSNSSVPTSPPQQQPPATSKPFSPQFEDISDAEDETTRPSTTVVSAAPMVPLDTAGLCRLGSLQTHMTPLSAGMYQVPSDAYTSAAFFSAAATAGGSLTAALPLGSWSGLQSTSIVPPSVVGRPPYFVPPQWLDHQQHYSPVLCRASPYDGLVASGYEAPVADVSPPLKPAIATSVNYPTVDVSIKTEISPVSIESILSSTAYSKKSEAEAVVTTPEQKYEHGNVGVKDEVAVKSEIRATDDEYGVRGGVNKPEVEPDANVSLGALAKSDPVTAAANEVVEQNKLYSMTRSRDVGLRGTESMAGSPLDSGLTSAMRNERTDSNSPLPAGSPSLRSSPRPGASRPDSIPDAGSSSGSRPSTPAASSTAASVPKVPPLRIIIPSKTSSAGTTREDSVNSSNSVVTSKAGGAGSLPYVVSAPQDAGVEMSLGSSDQTNDVDMGSESESHGSQVPSASDDLSKDAAIAAASMQYDSIMTRRRKIKQPKACWILLLLEV